MNKMSRKELRYEIFYEEFLGLEIRSLSAKRILRIRN